MTRAPLCLLVLASLAATIALAACSEAKNRTDTDFDTALNPGGGSGAGGGGGGPPSDGGVNIVDGAITCAEATFVDTFQALRKIYVSPSGSDTNDGLTTASPWRTLTNVARIQPGDLVELATGTYPCNVTITVQGTAASPVVFHATDGARTATFECSGDDYGFQLLGASYVAFDGLVVSGAREDNIRIATPVGAPTSFANHILIKNGFITGAGGADVRALGATSVDLISNEISASEALGPRLDGQGVELVSVRGARLLLNRIHDIPNDIAVHAHGGADTLLFDGNKVSNVSEGFRLGGTSTPAQFLTDSTAEYEARNAVLVNNAIWGTVSVGFSVYGCVACLSSNNTLDLAGAQAAVKAGQGNTGASAAARESHTTSFSVLNSILAFEPPAPLRIFDFAVTETSGFVSANNMVWVKNGTAGAIQSTPDVAGTGVLLDSDPGFIDGPLGNLRPGASSAAFGRASFVPQVTRDATGACRTERDIGAY